MSKTLEKKQEVETVDTKELELPDTTFSQDIENRVFQTIILQTLSNIEGICLLEGSLIDNLLRKASIETVKGIVAEQNEQKKFYQCTCRSEYPLRNPHSR